MGKNYRKLYESVHGKIVNGWEIHHIDFNHDNNDIENLISVPKEVHVMIHQCGFMDREEINHYINRYYEIKSINVG